MKNLLASPYTTIAGILGGALVAVAQNTDLLGADAKHFFLAFGSALIPAILGVFAADTKKPQ